MATASQPRAGRNLEQDQLRISSPLGTLRKYIYRYVSLEGAALVALFLALWFWFSLAMDYGLFKIFLFDWVQSVHWSFRATMLAAGVMAMVTVLMVTIFIRLFRQFTDSAMALLLEKRFPNQLGDRLITAVELSDPKLAAEYGYSPQLIRETIHEAADRVNDLPLREVFDWKRITRRFLLFAVLSVGLYILAAGAFCAVRAGKGEAPAMEGVGDFNEVATIWAERNLLMRNVIWPRKSYLEILPWPKTSTKQDEKKQNELSIPQNSVPPPVRVRAWRYVIADQTTTEGWRLLKWSELSDHSDWVGDSVPEAPSAWIPRDEATGLTVDEVELQLNEFVIRVAPTNDDGIRWQIASAADESGWRPLMWSDLKKEKLAGTEVPLIPGYWDPKAMPALAIGGGALTMPGGLEALTRLMVGPKYINLSVDEVEKQLKNVEADIAKEASAKPDQKQPASMTKVQQAERAIAVRSVKEVFAKLEHLVAMRETLDKVSAKATSRELRRVLRQLIVPSEVTLTYWSKRETNKNSMTRVGGNEYTATMVELKDSVDFEIRGEDYITPKRSIRVVERPRIVALTSEEDRPAYLFYRPGEGVTLDDIRGKFQPFAPRDLSVSSDTTTTEVPMGTTVTLVGKLSKPLKGVEIRVEAKDQRNYVGPMSAELLDDGVSFSMTLPNIGREQRFKVLFVDQDEVPGERTIVITPKEDTAPKVREFNPDEIVRKGRGNEGFLISASARVPFKGRVLDDNGLAKVWFGCRVIPADFLSDQKIRALFAVGAVPLLNPANGTTWLGTAYLTAITAELAKTTQDEAGPEQFIAVKAFEDAYPEHKPLAGHPGKDLLSKDAFTVAMKTKQTGVYRKLFREFMLSPDKWSMDFGEGDDAKQAFRWPKPEGDKRSPLGCDLLMSKLTWRDKEGKDKPIKEMETGKAQKRFIIEIRLVAEDTFLGSDLTKPPAPHQSASGETFTFVVTPENELLSRIGEEEEVKFQELAKAHKPLPENQSRMRDINATLAGPEASRLEVSNLNSFIARCDSMSEVLKTSHADAKGVYSAYERIIREMRINSLSPDLLQKVNDSIFLPLQVVVEQQYDRTFNAVQALRKALDNPDQPVPARVTAAAPKAADAYKQLEKLNTDINKILAAMQRIVGIKELIRELALIEKQEEDLESLTRKILDQRVKDALKD